MPLMKMAGIRAVEREMDRWAQMLSVFAISIPHPRKAGVDQRGLHDFHRLNLLDLNVAGMWGRGRRGLELVGW